MKMTEILKRHIWCIIAVLLIIVLFLSLSIGDDQGRENIAKNRQELQAILKTDNKEKRYNALIELAKEVGAGYVNTTIVGVFKTHTPGELTIPQNPISESELVLNINNALQTETMIDVCKTAARNFWVAIIATIIALISVGVAIIATIIASIIALVA